jgi:hypothetical protein
MLGREGGGVVMIDIFRAILIVPIGGTTAAIEEGMERIFATALPGV